MTIDPEAIQHNAQPPPVKIEELAVNNSRVPIPTEIRITPGQDSFSISYTALSFIKSEQIRFKYQLEGLDHDWIELGTRRTVYFNHVPPGAYVFHVIAANSDGVWNVSGASIKVVVVPPFWRTWWFLTLLFLLCAGLGVLVYERRVQALRRAKRVQETFSRQLIDYQEGERKRIASELHDGLSQSLVVIKNRAAMAATQTNDPEATGEQLDEIGAAASEAIDEVKEIAYNLRPVLLDRLGLTKALEAMLQKVAAANQLDLTFEIDNVDQTFSKVNEINFYRIVQECLNNIVKHAAASAASVKVKCEPHAVEIAVRDNGRGFDMELARQGRGFGLLGLSERARMIGGELVMKSVPMQGTTVRVRVDLGNGQHAG